MRIKKSSEIVHRKTIELADIKGGKRVLDLVAVTWF